METLLLGEQGEDDANPDVGLCVGIESSLLPGQRKAEKEPPEEGPADGACDRCLGAADAQGRVIDIELAAE